MEVVGKHEEGLTSERQLLLQVKLWVFTLVLCHFFFLVLAAAAVLFSTCFSRYNLQFLMFSFGHAASASEG